MHKLRIACFGLLVVVVLVGFVCAGRAAPSPQATAEGAPQVFKIDPPNWWAGHTINPVRLLIRGRNLSQARVELQGSGLSVSNVHSNATGSYLFIDLTIDPRAGRAAARSSSSMPPAR